MTADDQSEAQPPAPPTKTAAKPKKRRQAVGAYVSALTLVCLAAISLAVGGWISFTTTELSKRRNVQCWSFLEGTLNWFTMLGFLTLPVWGICLIIAAMRGIDKGRFPSVSVSRAESPLAFWYVPILYIGLALAAIIGLAVVANNIIGATTN